MGARPNQSIKIIFLIFSRLDTYNIKKTKINNYNIYLDQKGAFNIIIKKRLIYMLKSKRVPENLIT